MTLPLHESIPIYRFNRKPPPESRLLFDEKQLIGMFLTTLSGRDHPSQYTVLHTRADGTTGMGRWKLILPRVEPDFAKFLAESGPWRLLADELAEATLRFEDWDTQHNAVWKLTNQTVTDPGGPTLWRLGVWPD